MHVRFARLGATATCVSCAALFKVDAATLRSDGSVSPLPSGAGGTTRPAGPRRDPRETALAGLGAAAQKSARAPAGASQPARLAPVHSEAWSAMTAAIVAAVALAAALAVGVFVEEPRSTAAVPDAHPLPEPLILALDLPPALTSGHEGSGAAQLRVRLNDPSLLDEPPAFDAVTLQAVRSHLEEADDAAGVPMLLLAVRNVSAATVRDPQFTVELLDESGTVLRSWRGRVPAALAPGQTLEFEAIPPPDMDRAAGRLVLRAYASPLAANP
jgi:hypothetical protein